MSLMGDRNVYGNMVKVEVDHKPSFLDHEKSSEFVYMPLCDRDIEEQMVVGEEVVMDDDNAVYQDMEIAKSEPEEQPVYFEETLDTCEEVTVDYNESSPLISSATAVPTPPSSPQPRFHIKQEWDTDIVGESLELVYEDDQHNEEESFVAEPELAQEEEDEDEETIATFVTAAGQQLALYAVEDSDEIFAVAVYDESGEPPSNFQFLMKSDVERLIGEGAVRTVRKPSQIKKQLLPSQPSLPPMFTPKEEPIEHVIANKGDRTIDLDRPYELTKAEEHTWNTDENLSHNCHTVFTPSPIHDVNYSTVIKQEDQVTYVMMEDDNTIGILNQQSEDVQESITNDGELIEQSTVQYILLEGDQSDSELTFDEIQATLQSLKSSEQKPVQKRSVSRKAVIDRKTTNGAIVTKPVAKPALDVKQYVSKPSSQNLFSGCTDIGPSIQQNFSVKQNLTPVKQNFSDTLYQSESVQMGSRKKQSFMDKKSSFANLLSPKLSTISTPATNQNFVDASKTVLPNLNSPETSSAGPVVAAGPRIKRSRKQQLTSVNRGDSEIIIQPASALSEEENTTRRRGRRKKKPALDPDYNPRPVRPRRVRKAVKYSTVEVIEIDADEEQGTSQGKKDIIEITIEDNKEKGSSDKENEVIMVGDSSDDDDEPSRKSLPPILECKLCSRTFRQQRALITHSRLCPKSPANANRSKRKNLRASCDDSEEESETERKPKVKKIYTCKLCQKKFDAVVALARHVRDHKIKARAEKSAAMHKEERLSPKERLNASERRVAQISKTKKKKQNSPNRTWKTKKLDCNDCGRWFPSAASLAAHCLQHATKQSEKQIRQCQTCKKLMKTRLLYVRHMKMHSRVKQNVKSTTTVLRKKSRNPRQVTNNIASVRRRGRSRKP